MALTDKEQNFQGVQGYLKFSAVVVAEGEPLPPSRTDDDDDDEGAETADLQSLVLNAPTVNLEEYYLSAKIWRGDGLPQTDKGGKCGKTILS